MMNYLPEVARITQPLGIVINGTAAIGIAIEAQRFALHILDENEPARQSWQRAQ